MCIRDSNNNGSKAGQMRAFYNNNGSWEAIGHFIGGKGAQGGQSPIQPLLQRLKFQKSGVTFDNKYKYGEMLVEKNINLYSTCEHHLLPIVGKVHIAYISNGNVVGLSKMNRVVEYFSRRPQIQERLTEQIYHALSFILETENVALTIDAKHFCVKSRGVEDTECSTITSRLGGNFKAHPEVRAEFLALLKM